MKALNEMSDEETHEAYKRMLEAMQEQGTMNPVMSDDDGTGDGQNPDGGRGIVDPSQTAEPEPEPEPTGPEDEGDWRRRMETEIQRMRSENGRARKLSNELDAERKRNAELQQQLASLMERHKAAQEEARRPKLDTFTEEERLAFGEDTTDLLGRKFSQVDTMIDEQRQKLAEIDDSLSRIRAREVEQARNKVLDEVERHFGTDIWEAQETDAFKAWAEQINPWTHKTNHQSLYEADQALDGDRMMLLFGDFANATGWKSSNAVEEAPTPKRSLPTSANMAAQPSMSKGFSGPQRTRTKQEPMTEAEANAIMDRALHDPAWAVSEAGEAALKRVRQELSQTTYFLR